MLDHNERIMKRVLLITLLVLLSLECFAADNKRELIMSTNDSFIVAETSEWKIIVQKELTLRFADVNIKPKKGDNFNMQLYFKCDTPDLAQFDSPVKIKQSVLSSSEKYLPYTVEKSVTLKELHVKGWYGWYTILTDAKLANSTSIPAGEFKYITRGMIRLSPDSALGFSIMTNDLDTPEYKKLFKYISSFVKEKQPNK